MSDRLYSKDHEWIEMDADIGTIGVSDHAQEQLGDVVFVELPEAGDTVAKDDDIVVIESVKAASDIMAPLDGEIVEVNEALDGNPGMVNEHAMGDAWFFKIRPTDISQMDEYMDEAAYKQMIG